MSWTPTATREDVHHVLARYVRLEFSIRSGVGKLVIDEGRSSRKERAVNVREMLETLGHEEALDAICHAWLRRIVNERPASPAPRLHDGTTMRSVAPLRDVAPVMKLKSRSGGTRGERSDTRNWRATVGQKLKLIPMAQAIALVEAQEIRYELIKTRNQLEDARRVAGRFKSGGRNARNLRRHADQRVDELRSKERVDGDRLDAIVRNPEYTRGLDEFLQVCSRTRQVHDYIFGAESAQQLTA